MRKFQFEMQFIEKLRELYFKKPQTKENMLEFHKTANKLENILQEYQVFQARYMIHEEDMAHERFAQQAFKFDINYKEPN